MTMRLSVLRWGLFLGAFAAAAAGVARELPDFTGLVEANAAAVVNISTVQRRDARAQPRSRNDELDEFFRRFFPPDDERAAATCGRAHSGPDSSSLGTATFSPTITLSMVPTRSSCASTTGEN
jgi:S1-C subfamily serine protease